MECDISDTQCQKALGFHQKYLHLFSEDEQRSYGFGTTLGCVMSEFSFLGELFTIYIYFDL